MTARLAGQGPAVLLRNPAAVARFIEAWNAGVEVGALARRFNLGRSTCVILARRLRDQGQPVLRRHPDGLGAAG